MIGCYKSNILNFDSSFSPWMVDTSMFKCESSIYFSGFGERFFPFFLLYFLPGFVDLALRFLSTLLMIFGLLCSDYACMVFLIRYFFSYFSSSF